MKAIGMLTTTIIAVMMIGTPAIAQAQKCSTKVTAILNDPEANKPPEFSGVWEAYECSSCAGTRVDLREYNFSIEQKEGKISLLRDLHDLSFGPTKLDGRLVSIEASGTDKVGGTAMLNIEFSQDGTRFEGTVDYNAIAPGKRMIFGKLSDKDASAKRRQLSEKRRNVSGRAVTLALECLRKLETRSVSAKGARITELEARVATAEENLEKSTTLSNARDQILQVYADGVLSGGQRKEACTLYRAIALMNPAKAGLLGKHGC